MTLRALIVDDERPARAKIRRLLAGDARIAIVGEAADGIEALELVEAHAPELIFLDVQMPGLDGFEVVDAMGPDRDVVIVFSTAHEAHALRAFDAHAVDYLLKPYDGARLAAAVDKACRQIAGRARPGPLPTSGRRLVVRGERGWLAVETAELLRVSADDKETILFTSGGSVRARETMTAIERRLAPERFVRVHRGEIVRLDAVVAYEPSAHGDGVLTLGDGSAVALSRTRRDAFVTRFRGRA